jgi:hypothetical protein
VEKPQPPGYRKTAFKHARIEGEFVGSNPHPKTIPSKYREITPRVPPQKPVDGKRNSTLVCCGMASKRAWIS